MLPLQTAATRAALFTLYLYLLQTQPPATGQALFRLLESVPPPREERGLYRLRILKNAARQDASLAAAVLRHVALSAEGLNACVFTLPDGTAYVCYRGTGSGEWVDNGEGLSGIPEENVYRRYTALGQPLPPVTVTEDYATDRQVEALNWYRQVAAGEGWQPGSTVYVCGHSKGGNKAQFVAVHELSVTACFSFDGQGFSPEAAAALQRQYGGDYAARCRRLYSLSADNDYVNVLGQRLMPPENILYLESYRGFHYLEAILDVRGQLRPPTEQGRLSRYVEEVSARLMEIPPALRQYATRGVMNVIHQQVADRQPVGGDEVSLEETVAGIGIALGPLLQALFT